MDEVIATRDASAPASRRSWRGGIAARLLAVLLVVTFALTLITILLEYRTEQRSMREHLLSFGRSLARQGALACPDAVVIFDERMLKVFVDDLVAGEQFVVLAAVIRAEDGKTLAVSPEDGLQRDDDTTLRIEHPILVERGGDRLGTFVLGVSMAPMQAELGAKWARMLTRTSVGFLLVAALFWIALRLFVLRPLHRLDDAARRLGRGELHAPMENLGTTELGRLGRTMDAMRVNLLENHRSLADQNRRLLELDRLKTQFLTNVSHEMRTPLIGMLGGVELLADAPDGAVREEVAGAVQRSGEQLLELVDRLLDLAKLQDGNLLVQPRLCRPGRIVREVVERFSEAAQAKGLVLSCDVGELVDVERKTDPTRLRQVLAALLDNAIRFTQQGRVEVTLRLLQDGDGERLEVAVQDTGPGVPVEFIPRMFEPFSQADGSLTREHSGAGLGLTMARRIAQCLGGQLTVENRVSGGVRAVATLIVEAVPCSAPVDQGAEQAVAQRILVVDDAPDNQRLLQAFLRKAGFEVQLANNGREAIDAVQTGNFALVLMDLQMPVMDGVAAIRELRERCYTLPIVALTAHALAQDKQGCLDAGADAYETKPIAGKRLVEVVREQIAAKPR